MARPVVIECRTRNLAIKSFETAAQPFDFLGLARANRNTPIATGGHAAARSQTPGRRAAARVRADVPRRRSPLGACPAPARYDVFTDASNDGARDPGSPHDKRPRSGGYTEPSSRYTAAGSSAPTGVRPCRADGQSGFSGDWRAARRGSASSSAVSNARGRPGRDRAISPRRSRSHDAHPGLPLQCDASAGTCSTAPTRRPAGRCAAGAGASTADPTARDLKACPGCALAQGLQPCRAGPAQPGQASRRLKIPPSAMLRNRDKARARSRRSRKSTAKSAGRPARPARMRRTRGRPSASSASAT